MTCFDSIAKWRSLATDEKTSIRLRRMPRQIAQSMAFERDLVSLSSLEELHSRLNRLPSDSTPRAVTMSPAELTPHLAERALRLADGIARGEFTVVPLDENFIRMLHQRLCGDLVPEFGGRWRDRPVMVGGHEPPPPHAVPVAMCDFALDLNERLRHVEESPERLLEVLAFAEHRLLYIHPFVDFNGRVTRLFLGELLRRLDLPAVDLAPEDGEPRERYFAALRAADARDLSSLKTIWRERLARG